MDCPKCGVYNPEDRDHCWRCGAELPRQAERKPRDPQASARTWLYIAVAVMVLVTALRMCGFKVPGMGGSTQPTGHVPQPYAVTLPADAMGWF
ncbi:MAG: hypothetical protein ACOX3S_09075 [Anaerolineae bacterium]|jgi:hypothetical protein